MGTCPGYLSLPEGTLCFCRPQLAFLDHGRCGGDAIIISPPPRVDNAMERRFFVNELEADQQGFFGFDLIAAIAILDKQLEKQTSFFGVFFCHLIMLFTPAELQIGFFFGCHKFDSEPPNEGFP